MYSSRCSHSGLFGFRVAVEARYKPLAVAMGYLTPYSV
jgi:hypothetical protein